MIPKIPPKQSKFTVKGIQALRGIAALLVISTHVESALRESGKTGILWASQFAGLSGFGGVGVDIFFVISGFIMVYVGVRYFRREGSIKDFLVRRGLRVFPLYWFVTLLYIVSATAKTLLSVMAGQSFANALDFDLQWHRLLGALTLFPTYNELGNIQPIVGVGWTLGYEVFFYLVFALTLGIGFRFAPLVVLGVFSLLVFVPLPLGKVALITFLRDPILLEFPAGMLIGYAVVLNLRPPRWVMLSSIVLGLVGFLPDILLNLDYTYRVLFRGIPSVFLVFGLVFWEIRVGLRVPPLLVKLGNASYATYLIHSMVISYALLPAIKAVPFLQRLQVDVLGLVMFVIAASVGWLLHQWLEQPLQGLLTTRYEKASWLKRLGNAKQS